MKSILSINHLLIGTLCILNGIANAEREIIDLGTLNGANQAFASSINNQGQIVGWAGTNFPSSQGYACLYDSNGSGSSLRLSTQNSDAASINNNGQIVGSSRVSGYMKACLFDPSGAGKNINLGTLGGGWNPRFAFDLNDNKQIVGMANIRACLFDSTGAGNNIDLKTLGGRESYAFAINNSGDIVGTAQNASSIERACLFDASGGGNNIDLGSLGGDSSLAYANSNNGLIGGYAYTLSGFMHACLFDPTGAGNNIDLGTLGGIKSSVYSINDIEQIIGMAYNADGMELPCLFDPSGNGNNIDINALLPQDSGWILTHAYSINDNGWIVGQGINPAGEIHAYLLTPEPTSLLLFGLAGVALRQKKKANPACSD